jgi:hypothetical protein
VQVSKPHINQIIGAQQVLSMKEDHGRLLQSRAHAHPLMIALDHAAVCLEVRFGVFVLTSAARTFASSLLTHSTVDRIASILRLP